MRSTILATCAKFSRDIMHARAHSPNQSSFAIDSLNIRSFRYHFTHLFTLPYSYITSVLFSQTRVTSNVSVFLDSSSCLINKSICVTFEVTKLWVTLDERRKKYVDVNKASERIPCFDDNRIELSILLRYVSAIKFSVLYLFNGVNFDTV